MWVLLAGVVAPRGTVDKRSVHGLPCDSEVFGGSPRPTHAVGFDWARTESVRAGTTVSAKCLGPKFLPSQKTCVVSPIGLHSALERSENAT